MAGPTKYDTKQKQLLHQLIDTVFDEAELDRFCETYATPVIADFSQGMGKAEKIRLLIEHYAQNNGLGKLVINIKERKPEAYEAFVRQVQGGKKRDEDATRPRPAAPATITTFPIMGEAEAAAPPPDAMRGEIIYNAEALLSQSLLDRYQIEEVLDKSGLGAVFKAIDTRLQVEVAIKVIDLERVNRPALHERVRQEVRTAMKLDHPGIVKIYDFGQIKSLLYIIMEYIPGYNLRQAREYFKMLDPQVALPQIIQLAEQICLIVDYMHHHGVIHPSLKPENIMIKQGSGEGLAWRPVLINMGLLRPSPESLRSRDFISLRRLAYSVSPELMLGHNTDVRSDVYALGVTLYNLVVGRPPFRPRDVEEALGMHVKEAPPSPRVLYPDLPEGLERIILKALAKNPSDRYLSAREMAQDLARLLDKPQLPGPVAPAPSTEIVILPERRPLVVEPGGSMTSRFTLRNEGGINDHRQISVEGVPPEWVTISPSALTLAPGEEEQVEVTIHPPREALSRAGRHAVTIQAYNLRNAQQVNEIKTVLTVAPYTEFRATLWPQELTPGQETQVTVENLGNTTQNFILQPRSGEKIRFEPGQRQLKLGPGESGTADFQVFPRRHAWVGGTQVDTFSVVVTSTDGQSATPSGQLTSRGSIAPSWALAALLALILLVCAVAAFYPIVYYPGTRATATFEAVLLAGTATAEAAVASGVQNQQATAEAVAATASWLRQDDDRDGLLNGDELNTYNTLVDDPDTDDDGLSDGKEVLEFRTNPLEPDTDSDGLLDGYEIEQGWNPLELDTDADGIPDGIDPNPGIWPTATPITPVLPPAQGVIGIQFSHEPVFLELLFFGNEPRYQVNEFWGSVTIEVVLSRAASERISVNYATLEGSAKPWEDYIPITEGTLIFDPGETTERFTVQIVNDDEFEVNNSFYVTLSTPVPTENVEVITPRAEITVISDDE